MMSSSMGLTNGRAANAGAAASLSAANRTTSAMAEKAGASLSAGVSSLLVSTVACLSVLVV